MKLDQGVKSELNFQPVFYYSVQRGSNFETADEILKCDYSNHDESYRAVLSCSAFDLLYKVVPSFAFVDEIMDNSVTKA